MNITTKATLGMAIALMMVAMILSLKNHSEKKDVLRENKYLTEKLAEQNAGTASASLVNDMEERLRKIEARKEAELEKIRNELATTQIQVEEKNTLNELVQNREKARTEQLSPIAQKIKGMPAIGKVITANSDWGIVSFDAGSGSGVAAGMEFAVRRDHYLIARVKVQTAEANKSIADIVGTVSEGMQIQTGDDMISYPVQ